MAALALDFIKHSENCENFTLDFKHLGFGASPLFFQTLGPCEVLELAWHDSLLKAAVVPFPCAALLPHFFPCHILSRKFYTIDEVHVFTSL